MSAFLGGLAGGAVGCVLTLIFVVAMTVVGWRCLFRRFF